MTDEWKNWKNLQESDELKALIETANGKLQKSAAAKRVGGKGKKGKGQ